MIARLTLPLYFNITILTSTIRRSVIFSEIWTWSPTSYTGTSIRTCLNIINVKFSYLIIKINKVSFFAEVNYKALNRTYQTPFSRIGILIVTILANTRKNWGHWTSYSQGYTRFTFIVSRSLASLTSNMATIQKTVCLSSNFLVTLLACTWRGSFSWIISRGNTCLTS